MRKTSKKHQSGLLRSTEKAQKKMEKQYGRNSNGWPSSKKRGGGKRP
jgi:hypothetical protein